MASVLIVEDEPLIMMMAELALQESGYRTEGAYGVREAEAALLSPKPFDLVFTDLKLAEANDGGTRVGLIAKTLRHAVPVLYTSAVPPTKKLRAQFVENHAFLAKPYAPEQLIAEIRHLLDANGQMPPLPGSGGIPVH